jgi:hypothetical protein
MISLLRTSVCRTWNRGSGMGQPNDRVAADGAIALRDVCPVHVLPQPEKNAQRALVCAIGQHDFVTFAKCRTSRSSARHVRAPPSFGVPSNLALGDAAASSGTIEPHFTALVRGALLRRSCARPFAIHVCHTASFRGFASGGAQPLCDCSDSTTLSMPCPHFLQPSAAGVPL